MKKAEIDNEFIFKLLEEGLIYEYKPMRFKTLDKINKEVLILK